MPDTRPAITATGLRKAYDEHVVLDGIDLRIPQGSVYAAGWIGWVAGRISGRNQAARRQGPTSELICSCGHGYGMHEDEKRCHGVDPSKRNGVHTLDPCPCRLYDGPEPLPRAWTPVQLPNAE